jgi:uncharacterized cupredoxin-like copper-binding protein
VSRPLEIAVTSVRRRPALLVAAVVAVVGLAVASSVALAAATGAFQSQGAAPSGVCATPELAGAVMDVTVTDMGRGMMQGGGMGGSMRVLTSRASVPAGTVSLRVVNRGSLVHELVVLPLADGQQIGERAVGADNRVAETGSVGEASRTCGADSGDGIDPGALGWVTLDLAPGRYELVCNLTGHYVAGMYTELTVHAR